MPFSSPQTLLHEDDKKAMHNFFVVVVVGGGVVFAVAFVVVGVVLVCDCRRLLNDVMIVALSLAF